MKITHKKGNLSRMTSERKGQFLLGKAVVALANGSKQTFEIMVWNPRSKMTFYSIFSRFQISYTCHNLKPFNYIFNFYSPLRPTL